MAQRVSAIFEDRDAAERAADALVDLGADRGQISTLARGEEEMGTPSTSVHHAGEHVVEPAREVGDTGAPLTTTDEHEAAHGAAAGAAIGAIAGIAAGLAMLAVPGFGLVMAAGPLAWAIGAAAGTAAAGAVAGGVYGGLRDIGIGEHHARSYEASIRSGRVLMTALVPSLSEARVREVLAEYGAQDVSFYDDTPMVGMDAARPVGAGASSDYPPYGSLDRGTTSPSTFETVNTPVMSSPPGAGYSAPAAASYAAAESTTGAGYNASVARGEAKQVEGEWRDRAADRTGNVMDKMAAKGEKFAGKVQEEYGEEEEEAVENLA